LGGGGAREGEISVLPKKRRAQEECRREKREKNNGGMRKRERKSSKRERGGPTPRGKEKRGKGEADELPFSQKGEDPLCCREKKKKTGKMKHIASC